MNAMKRTMVGFATATLLASGALMAAPATQAQPPGYCSVTPEWGTGAYSQCGLGVWHQVHITCWSWWNWWSHYDRWGNVAWGPTHSQAWCDVPFSMQTWTVVTWGWDW
ncbi:hypothetical protein [Nocardia concava]|uniref:hypothetical protein n=1 Tax=Nocardia concava TaxID=257281 RepID=UPI0002D77E4F|nr:hypothetical protein [Nocardia concava]